MKKISVILLALLVPGMLAVTSCGGSKEEPKDTAKQVVKVEINHSQLLLDEIAKNGDIMSNEAVPTMIDAKDVKANLGEKQLVIDLRAPKDFADGHIKEAVNMEFEKVLDYFKANDTKKFDKVVMVCYSGQTAAYANAILYMLGHSNVATMKWGMASWNKKTSVKWSESVSDKYAKQLDTVTVAKVPKGELPKFDCMHQTGTEILEARAAKLFADGFSETVVIADDVIADPASYFIVNYWPANLYKQGHLAGAVQYAPKKSMSVSADLLTLPTDKEIVTYCFTGQTSAFVTAYLRILGYNAKSLKFGANGFMNTTLKSKEEFGGHGFEAKKINNFELEKSEYKPAEGEKEAKGGC